MIKKQRYWFKRRRYGYGWMPSSWQGHVTVIVCMLPIFYGLIFLKDVENNTLTPEVRNFILLTIISVSVLVGTSYKMGPPPKWRWGSKPTDDPELDY
ncbi:MAG: hypothetical protein GW762_01895 [Candidatus Pacebacteria bacterium]|nr:hypothetical protein [Candidatus Paceibacterota bacterium]